MIGKTIRLVVVGLLLSLCTVFVDAQTGAITGSVVDANGSVVPNATVVVKGAGGQDYTVTTNENGFYRVPGVAVGSYTITVTAPGFKKSVVNNVKVDIGTPSTANVSLEAGNINEIVEVASGAEVLQTETATVGTNITGRQINETPISSRDALDLILRLPGIASAGAPRQSSINGLPKGAIQMSIDGVDVQDNSLRSGDGFFTYVRPRVDAIEEVTVSTASPGAESSGDGAVQVRFVTKRGTNDYRGTVYWQTRNYALNSAYWYNNRDKVFPGSADQRDRIKLNQPGFAVGGPIPFPRFGIGGKEMDSGKDKAYFFTNYEIFRLPGSQARQRTVFTDDLRNGIFKFVANGQNRSVNLMDIATAGGLPNTIDPTVAGVLSEMAATFGQGSLSPASDLNHQLLSFTNPGTAERRFWVLRLDANVNKSNSAEFVMNRQNFKPSIDFINGRDAPYPGLSQYGQGGIRKSWSYAVRSTITQNLINEARLAISGGATVFTIGCCAQDFASQDNRLLSLAAPLGLSVNLHTVTGGETRSSPTHDITDNVTWNRGNHSFTFGGQIKRIETSDFFQSCCPTVTFGIDQTNDTAAYDVFTNSPLLAGASTTDVANARAYYAALTGRITGFTQTAYTNQEGEFEPGYPRGDVYRQWTYGLYLQDSWRFNRNLTFILGLRWQPRMGIEARTPNLTKFDYNDLFGQSGGPDSMFRPGPNVTNVIPTFTLYEVGEKMSPDDWNNWAPSFGVVWSPNFERKGIFGTILGGPNKSVFRAGWSRSFVREGMAVPQSLLSGNTGYEGSLNVSRSFTLGNMIPGTLLRTPGNSMLTPDMHGQTKPTYPIANTVVTDAPGAYTPDYRTGYVDSFNVGYQRELDKNTVIEVRYVGNRGHDLERQRNINEVNVLENGLIAEFKLAQQNLYENIKANRCQAGISTANCQYNFAYFGPGTGTSPLPITLAYFIGSSSGYSATLNAGSLGQVGSVTSAAASNTALYNSSNFRTAGFLTPLSNRNPNVVGWATALRTTTAAQIARAIAAGLPANFLQVNPLNFSGGSWVIENTSKSWYDSATIEVRRRLSQGLRVQASYVFSKSQANGYAVSSTIGSSALSSRGLGDDLAKTLQPFDLRHNFKVDATYDLPFGRGRRFFSNSGNLVNALVGGFSILPLVTWTSGSPIALGNVTLVGMNVKELEKAVKINKNAFAYVNGVQTSTQVVTWLPDDIILNSIRAFAISITSPNGYSTTNGALPNNGGGIPPTGRYIAPACTGNSINYLQGMCGFNNLIIHGPGFFKFDVGLNKKFYIGERLNIEARANFLNALNYTAFRVGGFGGDTVSTAPTAATFGQLALGSAYRDNNTTNDPGGRVIDLQIRVSF